MEEQIARGAEAIILKKENKIIKNRIAKPYRLPILDEKLRKQRTKKESRLIEKASKIIPVPKLIKTDEKNKKMEIEFINGKKLSQYLDSLPNNLEICRIIGNNIAKLHDANIIHGDLTTSNMIYVKQPNNKVFFIDFGLGFESSKIEDKAVDLHLIKQALEAKHFNNYKKFFEAVKEGYKISKHAKETFKRLEKVEKRGRYKQTY
jgi:TP53 regulating kinase-like protein